MIPEEKRKIAQKLSSAELEGREVTCFTDSVDFSVEEAYDIQNELINIRLQQSHQVVGAKMGLTSKAKMNQMGVTEPIYGYLLDYMHVNGDKVSMKGLIHPKVEAEIAFMLGEDLQGPDITADDVLRATDFVLPALEIIDSRYKDFNFTLPDVIADNASSSRVVYGTTLHRPEGLELDLIGVTLRINGEIKGLGSGAAVLGHPAASVAMLANMLARTGKSLRKGQYILAGAVTSAIQVKEGDYITATYDQLGTVELKIEG